MIIRINLVTSFLFLLFNFPHPQLRPLVAPCLFPSPSLVELTEDILKQLMDLVFTLVCNGELSLARVLRKNILDKVEQKKLMRYTNSLKPLAARGVSARYHRGHGFSIYIAMSFPCGVSWIIQ